MSFARVTLLMWMDLVIPPCDGLSAGQAQQQSLAQFSCCTGQGGVVGPTAPYPPDRQID